MATALKLFLIRRRIIDTGTNCLQIIEYNQVNEPDLGQGLVCFICCMDEPSWGFKSGNRGVVCQTRLLEYQWISQGIMHINICKAY